MDDTIIYLRVEKILRETRDAITVVLENAGGTPVPYRAGQFLTFLFRFNNRELRRSYSLSSAPDIDRHLTITVKRVENGEVSRYLLDHLREGDILTSLPPTGLFTLDTAVRQQRDLFLIGGGSGITPLFGLLKTILKEEPESHVTLLYANHSEASAIYFSELNRWREAYPERFTCLYFFSDPADRKRHVPQRLHNALFEKTVENHLHFNREDARFYICGPGGLMRMAQLTLLFMGFSQEQLRRENFVSPVVTAALSRYHAGEAAEAVCRLRYGGKVYSFPVPAGENILQAALDRGIRLPYSCRGGLCGTCVARCTGGKVHLLMNEVLTPGDLEKGLVLTCVAMPRTPQVEIAVE